MVCVLIVDDSPEDARLAGRILETIPHLTHRHALDGRDALVDIEQAVPDIVLTGLQMPNLNGLELVQTLRRTHPYLPVILMTGAGCDQIAVDALLAGAASYVPKSKLASELPTIVERVLAAAGGRTDTAVLQRMVSSDCRFVLENDLALIAALSRYLREMVRALSFTDDCEHLRIGVAIEEALINAYYHGNLELSSELREQDHNGFYQAADERKSQLPYKDRCVIVDARITPASLTFVIRDEGYGFDPARLPNPADPHSLERPCGRGVMLMRTFMDEVSYNDRGNEVTLVKRLTPRPSAS